MTIAAALDAVSSRITAAATQAGRDPDSIRLLPVSKTKPPADVLEARRAGYIRFGENKVQEAHAKWTELKDTDVEWAVIGHLQRNKARFVAEFASEFQALDSLRLAAELDRRLQAAGRTLDVLVQVNSSGEEQKFGLPPEEVLKFSREVAAFDALNIRGIMTLAVFSADKARVGACFEVMQQVQRELRDAHGAGWDELSMGMSGDYELAIAHGATCVRVGQAIFGNRLDPNDYWPGAAS